MKAVVFAALGLFLFLGTLWSEDSPRDNEAFSLMKLDRAGLLKAIGTPLKEVTDSQYTRGLWDSIVVQRDQETKSFYFYFLSKDRVAAFSSVDYFAKADTRLQGELDGLKEEVEGQGYQEQKDPAFSGPLDAVYFDPKAREFVGARVVTDAGASVLFGLYTASREALDSVAGSSADLYNTLK